MTRLRYLDVSVKQQERVQQRGSKQILKFSFNALLISLAAPLKQ